MGIKELITLATNGYKPSDVKEILSMMKELETTETKTQSEDPQTPFFDTVPGDGVAQPEPGTPKEIEETKEPEIDYKSLYEKTKIELKEAQTANVNRNQSDNFNNESDSDIVKNLVQKFM